MKTWKNRAQKLLIIHNWTFFGAAFLELPIRPKIDFPYWKLGWGTLSSFYFVYIFVLDPNLTHFEVKLTHPTSFFYHDLTQKIGWAQTYGQIWPHYSECYKWKKKWTLHSLYLEIKFEHVKLLNTFHSTDYFWFNMERR